MGKRSDLEAAIAALESQRANLGDATVDAAVAGLKRQLREPGTPALAGERKFVTVMFADLSGFTALSETMDPEAVRELMNLCFDALVPVIHKYDGTVDKFIGDEIMALFGAPVIHENDPERALLAALEMLQALERFNQAQDTALDIHIGINSGLVLAGGLGSSERQEYSVMGDAVNLAARLVDAAPDGQIFAGPDTYRLAAHLFHFEPLPPMLFKGKTEPLPVYRLRGVKAVPAVRKGIAGLESPLVGREAEVDHFNRLLASLLDGAGSVIAVVGEAGVGKSRLVAEIARTVADEIRWVEGRALSYTTGMTYWLAQELLRALAGVDGEATAAEQGEQLRDYASGLLQERLVAVYPFLARMLDIPLSAEMAARVRYLDPQMLHLRIRRAFVDLVRATALSRPVVLVWEDLHWGDPSSFQILESLAPLTREVPLLICLNFRPRKEEQVWQTHKRLARTLGERYHFLKMQPLVAAASARLMSNLLQVNNIPDGTRQLILEKAEGNPFFLEEILRTLLDTGLIVREGERLRAAAAVDAVEVPDTLHGVIGARIDRLNPADKETLQTASVVGRVFQKHILHQLHARQAMTEPLEPSLRQLQHRELIRPLAQGKSVPEYIFKHAVTHEVAYNSLLIARRRRLHSAVAQAIEALFPDNLDELSATLAFHYRRGDRPEKAVPYLEQAAKRAADTYANEEALAFYRQTLQLLPPLQESNPGRWTPVLVRVQEGAGLVLNNIGAYEEARSAFRTALEHLSPDQRLDRARITRHIADGLMTQREAEKAIRAYEEAGDFLTPRPVAPSAGWWETWLDVELARAWALYLTMQADELALQLDRIRPHVEQHGLPSQKVKFFNALALMHMIRSRWYMIPEEAIAYGKKIMDFGEPAAILYGGTLFSGLFAVGFIHLWREELDEAKANLQEALDVAEEMGITSSQLMALTYLAVISRMRGDEERVVRHGQQSLALARSEQNKLYGAVALANLAWVAWQRGNKEQARRDAQEALQALQALEFPLLYLAAFPLVALALEEEDVETAVTLAGALIHPKAKRFPPDLTEALELGIRHGEEDNPEAAAAALARALARAQETGYF